MTTLIQAIAVKYNVSESAITEIREWPHIYFAIIKGVGGRFVSKKLAPKQTIEQVTAAVAAKLQRHGIKQATAWCKYGKTRVYVWEREFVDVKIDGSVSLANIAKGSYKTRVITACQSAGISCGYVAA